jgi:hypothetical protein
MARIDPYKIQSVTFDNTIWDIFRAHQWLVSHGLYPIKSPHMTDNYIRFRFMDPNKFERLRTNQLPNGVNLIIGFS